MRPAESWGRSESQAAGSRPGGSYVPPAVGVPLKAERRFLERVWAADKDRWRKGPTLHGYLDQAGHRASAPDRLSDAGIPERLLDLVLMLGELGVFPVHTAHLSDRELYRWLREDQLPEPTDLPKGRMVIADPPGGWGPDDLVTSLRFCAHDDEEPREWAGDVVPMPPKQTSAHDRSGWMPDPFRPAPDEPATREGAAAAIYGV